MNGVTESQTMLARFGCNGWTGGQYSVFRVILGAYLAVHFARLIPWSGEVFSSAGMLAHSADSPLSRLFPNVLSVLDSPSFVTGFLVMAVGLSVIFAAGWRDRLAAVALWYILTCLFGRNPLTANPSLPFVGWMLLAHACIPGVPRGSLGALRRPNTVDGWRFPPALFGVAWIVMSIGYSYSGCMKLSSPSWIDGTALARVLENPLARPTLLREWLLSLPGPLLRAATWGGLGLELAFAPLVLFRRVRPWVWGAMVGMHLSLMVLIDFADLSTGMVMVHLFTFDPGWIAAWRAKLPSR